jgi:hypothetical protein
MFKNAKYATYAIYAIYEEICRAPPLPAVYLSGPGAYFTFLTYKFQICFLIGVGAYF